MNEIVKNEAAVSVIVNDVALADELYEKYLEIADNEGFKGDRMIFQKFIDARSAKNENLTFDYGFSWNTFDRVEAGFMIDNTGENEVKTGYCIVIGVNMKDELTMDCGMLINETFNSEKLRFIKVCGPSYAVAREMFSKRFNEIIEVFSSYLETRKNKFIAAFKSAKETKITGTLDEFLMKSHMAASTRNIVKQDLANISPENLTVLDVARSFARLGSKNLAYQGNRYFEVAGRFIDES